MKKIATFLILFAIMFTTSSVSVYASEQFKSIGKDSEFTDFAYENMLQ